MLEASSAHSYSASSQQYLQENSILHCQFHDGQFKPGNALRFDLRNREMAGCEGGGGLRRRIQFLGQMFVSNFQSTHPFSLHGIFAADAAHVKEALSLRKEVWFVSRGVGIVQKSKGGKLVWPRALLGASFCDAEMHPRIVGKRRRIWNGFSCPSAREHVVRRNGSAAWAALQYFWLRPSVLNSTSIHRSCPSWKLCRVRSGWNIRHRIRRSTCNRKRPDAEARTCKLGLRS